MTGLVKSIIRTTALVDRSNNMAVQHSQTFMGRSKRSIATYSNVKAPKKFTDEKIRNNVSRGVWDHTLVQSTDKTVLKGEDDSTINTSAIRTHHPKEGIRVLVLK